MQEYFDTYCPECDTEVHAKLMNRPATLTVIGKPVDFIETVAICPFCGEIIGDSRIEGPNLERAYAEFFKKTMKYDFSDEIDESKKEALLAKCLEIVKGIDED